jgi:hypothetical protein
MKIGVFFVALVLITHVSTSNKIHYVYSYVFVSILIYKGDTNFWDGFFIIHILPLKKLPTKKVTTIYKKYTNFGMTFSLFLFCPSIKLPRKKVTTNYSLLFF